jgi:hypothetical protein
VNGSDKRSSLLQFGIDLKIGDKTQGLNAFNYSMLLSVSLLVVSWTLGGFVSSKQESLSKIVQLTEDTNAYTNRNSYTNPYTDSLTKCYTNF